MYHLADKYVKPLAPRLYDGFEPGNLHEHDYGAYLDNIQEMLIHRLMHN